MNENTPSKIYIIVIQGRLKEQWADWLNGAVLHIENRQDTPIQTAITVCVPDQAALRGILNKLWDLNLTLVSMQLKVEETPQGERHENEI